MNNHGRGDVAAAAADDDDDDAGNAVAVPPIAMPEVQRLESLEQWLQVNGLPAPRQNNDEERWERVQDRQRVQQEKEYQQAIHSKVFDHGADAITMERRAKVQQLKAWQGKRLTITCRDNDNDDDDDDAVRLENLDLVPLAACCDFIYALASTWRHYHPNEKDEQNDGKDDDDDDDDDDEEEENNMANSAKNDANVVQLNLPEFTAENVQTFVDIVHGKQTLHDVSSGSTIVEICRLANFLQNDQILQETVQILLHSIDTANCLALTQLADQLHLPGLFEAALQHMMQSVHNLEEGDCWDHLTPELRERIAAIQSAIQSSIHDQRSALYFGSLKEYLAIFAERVQYYKDRLVEATEQQENRAQSPGWHDTQRKIERQRARLHTLQVAFHEQKKLFGRSLS